VQLPAHVAGAVELCVGSGTAAAYHVVTISRGTAAIAEGRATDPDARLSGSQQDWIEALGPAADHGRLHIEGDERLAVGLLERIGPAARERTGFS
jgi:hypothetical protein